MGKEFTREMLGRSTYPDQFVGTGRQKIPRSDPAHLVRRKLVFLKLQFKDTHLLNGLRQKLTSALGRTFRAAHLQLLPAIRTIELNN